MEDYALIMAGGVGARFCPRSRERSPKQLLEIIGNGTMIQNTVYRLDPIVSSDKILIVTNRLQYQEVERQLPNVLPENIIIEPFGRNTAPAIGLAAEVLKKRVGDAIMIALPADHLVHDIRAFHEVLERAIAVAESTSGLVTIGIKPTRPETGFGYIQFIDDAQSDDYKNFGAFRIKTFAEKPSLQIAQHFLESGDYVWNSGIFIWKASTINSAISEHLPEIAEELQRLSMSIDTEMFPTELENAYQGMRGISIDVGVMEKSANAYVIPGDFGWSDLGSWDEVYRMLPEDDRGNTLNGNVFMKDAKNCYISGPSNKLIAAIGIEDQIIIDTGDALLLCTMGRSQEIKEVVDYLRRKQMNEYL